MNEDGLSGVRSNHTSTTKTGQVAVTVFILLFGICAIITVIYLCYQCMCISTTRSTQSNPASAEENADTHNEVSPRPEISMSPQILSNREIGRFQFESLVISERHHSAEI